MVDRAIAAIETVRELREAAGIAKAVPDALLVAIAIVYAGERIADAIESVTDGHGAVWVRETHD